MNNNAKKWVEALRSGEFKQGTKHLRGFEETYCCLGVACEIYRRETGNGRWVTTYERQVWLFEADNTSIDYFMHPTVQKWIGLREQLGAASTMPGGSLTALNDSCGYDFTAIADMIEKYEADLFVSEGSDV